MLTYIQSVLDKEQIDNALNLATDELPYEHLLVFLGKDFKDREQILEVTAQEQPLSLEIEKPTSYQYYRVQFRIILPFKVEETSLTQMASLILFLNQLLDFPGFELDELENEVSYRYVWLTQTPGLDDKLIISIVGIILLILQLFIQTINRIADGEVTFNQVLEEIINMSQNIK